MALAHFRDGIQTPSIIGDAPRPSPITLGDEVVLTSTPTTAVTRPLTWSPTFTYVGPTGAQQIITVAPTITLPLAGSIFTLQGVRAQATVTTTVNNVQFQSSLFSNANTVNYGGTIVAANSVRTFVDVVKINALAGIAAGTLTNYRSANFTPTLSAEAGASITVTNWNGLEIGTILSGAGTPAVTTYRGVLVNDAVLSAGTIGTSCAFDIATLATATTNLSLRSAGASVQMRHAGPAVFGANAAPTNASVGLEVQSTTKALLLPRLTLAQRNALTPLPGMLIYCSDATILSCQKFQGGNWVNF